MTKKWWGMLADLTRRVQERWGDMFPGIGWPGLMRYVAIPGSMEGGTVTFLAFSPRANEPVFVAKTHRYPGDADFIRHERLMLETVSSRDSELPFAYPRVLACEQVGRYLVLLQTAVKGSPLRAALTRRGLPDTGQAAINYDVAARCVGGLHRATWCQDPRAIAQAEKRLGAILREFLDVFTVSPEAAQVARELARNSREVLARGVCMIHGDFTQHNVLLDRNAREGGPAVIDWAFGQSYGLPLHDFFFFATTYFLQLRRAPGLHGFSEAFRASFFERNDYSYVVEGTARALCREIGLDQTLLEPLFGMFLIEQAVLDYRRLTWAAARGAFPRFAVHLGLSLEMEYQSVLKQQFWTHFFEIYASRRSDVTLSCV